MSVYARTVLTDNAPDFGAGLRLTWRADFRRPNGGLSEATDFLRRPTKTPGQSMAGRYAFQSPNLHREPSVHLAWSSYI